MKKMKLAAVSAVLCLMLGVTAQAAGSASSAVPVSQTPVTAAVMVNGSSVESDNVIPKDNTSGPTQEVGDSKAREDLGIGSEVEYSSYLTNVVLTLNDEIVKLASGQVTLTFRVADATPDSTVIVYHWADENSEPEIVPAVAGNQTVTATFKSLSPIQILVLNTASGDSGSGSSGSGSSGSSSSSSSDTAAASVSPKTAEGYELYAAAAVAVAALAGAVVFTKKARA